MDKMRNHIVFLLVLVGLVGCTMPPEGLYFADISEPHESVMVNYTQLVVYDADDSVMGFQGFGVGKSHIGRFNEWNATVLFDGDRIVGVRGVIVAESVQTDSRGLDRHLRSPDFFMVDEYPIIELSDGYVVDVLNTTMVRGNLAFRGIEKQVTFPIVITPYNVTADFLLDVSAFELQYPGVDDHVRIYLHLNR